MITPPIHPPVPVTEMSAVIRPRDENSIPTASNLEVLSRSFFGPIRPPSYIWLDASAYTDPSEEKFERMAKEQPSTLVNLLLVNVLRPADLSFAAEAAGLVSASELVRAPLLALLDHASGMVREGAVYGLAHHMSIDVKARLEYVAENDSSPGVREAAREVLETQG